MRPPLVALLIVAAAATLAAAQTPANADDAAARLLALEDARRLDAPALNALAAHGSPAIRARTARAVAATADPRAAILLARLGKDRDPSVRAAAAEGAGRLLGRAPGVDDAKAVKKIEALLRRLLDDPVAQVRAAAAWGLGASGLAAGEDVLLRRLRGERDPGVKGAILQELWRTKGARWAAVATAALADGDPRVRLAAAWSLSRSGSKDAVQGLVRATRDTEPTVRLVALDGIRRGAFAEGWDAGLAGIQDADERVRVAALLALAPLVETRPAAQGSPSLDAALAPLLRDADPRTVHRRVVAVRLAGAARCCREDLVAVVGAGERWVSGEALEALARSGAPEAGALAESWLGGDSDETRVAGVRAVALLPGGVSRLVAHLADPSAAVRLAAVERLGESADAAVVEALEGRLGDADPAVRAAAVEALGRAAGNGVPGAALAPQALVEALAREGGATVPDAAVALIDALAAGKTLPPAVARTLHGLKVSKDAVVARSAWAALARHGTRSPLPEVATGKDLEFYRGVVAWAARERWLEIVTWRGTMQLRLDNVHAPLTCFRVSELAEKKFFDGLTFHRVVPDFVAQGGDPRGDGWGGPGFTLRDELSLSPYEAGGVGLAHSGPDTAGSQFFVTLTAQPHLTGRYPVIGTVVNGLDVAERLRVGDRIIRVRSGEGPLPAYVPVWYGPVEAGRLDREIPHWRDEREAYVPKDEWLALLRTARLRYELHVAMGTWCSDSREQGPRLEKVLAALGADSPFEAPRLTAIDRSKAIDPAAWPFGTIGLVPTIVVAAGGSELGRIAETPSSGSLEEDLARILAPIEGWQLPDPAPKE